VIEVKGTKAICDGGGGALGHPIEYIQLYTVSDKPSICKYCGLRFKKAAGSHHH
jgi:NADH dehydrogenase (ubiquinone) Fe-S protein 6